MRSFSPLLIVCATLAAVLPAAAQTGPRRPPADTLRFGTTRPSAGDSIRMAEYDAADEDAPSADVARADDQDAESVAAGDTVPPARRDGPYARARGTGPFSVQASGRAAARPPRGLVVWLEGRAATRRDTATSPRVASGQPARRDTASTASRPAARDTAGTRGNGQSASASTTAGRTGSSSTTTSTTGRNGPTTTTSSSTSGRTGSTSTSSSSSRGARARTHTVASGETFYAIARRYGVTAAQLRALNPDVEMDRLEVGHVLRLPAAARDSRAGSGSGAGSTSGSAAGSGRTGGQTQPRQGAQGQRRSHMVAAGETLFGIARRYGVTVDAIREANDMEGDQVRTGQRLVIPPAR